VLLCVLAALIGKTGVMDAKLLLQTEDMDSNGFILNLQVQFRPRASTRRRDFRGMPPFRTRLSYRLIGFAIHNWVCAIAASGAIHPRLRF
jgi:hypothetical protein